MNTVFKTSILACALPLGLTKPLFAQVLDLTKDTATTQPELRSIKP